MIMDCAARVFADSGYHNASMVQVANCCGVSKALLYHYYESKADLLYSLLRTHLEYLCRTVEMADDISLSSGDRLRVLVRALLESYRDADAKHTVLINELSVLPRELQDGLKVRERELVSRFSGVIGGLDDRLAGNRARLIPVTMSLFGILNWHYLWFREGGMLSRDDYADLVVDLVIGGVNRLADDISAG